MTWTDIFTASAISSVIAAGASTLLQTLLTERFKASIKEEYDTRAEKAKDEIKHASDLELERFKSSLAQEATRRQISFQHLQEQRVARVAECYASLNEVYNSIVSYTAMFEAAGGPTRQERRQKATQAMDDFSHLFLPNRVFFPKKLGEQLMELRTKFVNAFNSFLLEIDMNPRQDTSKWVQIAEDLQGSIKAAMSEVEEECRKLLGDH